MFERCKSISDLNQERVLLIQQGMPAILVNKEFAKRKAVFLSGTSMGFKKLEFIEVPLPELPIQVGIDYAYEDEDTCTLYIVTGGMNG